jgi:hypothetical protein
MTEREQREINPMLYHPWENFDREEQQRLQGFQLPCPTCGQPARFRGILWKGNGGVFSCSYCGDFVEEEIAFPVKLPRREEGPPLALIVSAGLSTLLGLALVLIWYTTWRAGKGVYPEIVLAVALVFLIQALGLWTRKKWAYFVTIVTFSIVLPLIGWILVFGFLRQDDVRRSVGLPEKGTGESGF